MEIPEAPTNCCMSGCANCVWVDYALDVVSKFEQVSVDECFVTISNSDEKKGNCHHFRLASKPRFKRWNLLEILVLKVS